MIAALDLGLNDSPSISGIFTSSPKVQMVRYLSPKQDPDVALYWQSILNGTQPGKIASLRTILLVDGKMTNWQLAEQRTSMPLDSIYVQPTAVAKRLDQIKDCLALSVTQMADLFGVTRKTIYDWYEGAEPRSNTMYRIETLIDVLSEAPQEIDVKRLKAIWGIAASGQSFRTIFNDDSIDITTLRSKLVAKLHELSSRMVTPTSSVYKANIKIGEAHLAEFDRRADFS